MATAQQHLASDLVLDLLRAAKAGKAQPGDERAAVMAIQGLLPDNEVKRLQFEVLAR